MPLADSRKPTALRSFAGRLLRVAALCCALCCAPSGEPGLLPTPLPPLARFEPAVRVQLEQLGESLGKQIAAGSSEAGSLAAAYGELGMHLQAYGLFDGAAPCYRNAATLDPTDHRWPHLLGLVEQQLGNDEQARAAFLRTLELAADDVAARVHLARLELEANRPAQARTSFEQALALDPTCAACQVGLGRVELLEQRHARALDRFLAAAELAPYANSIHYNLALAYRGLGDDTQAEQHLLRRGPTRAGVTDPLREALRRLPVGSRALRDQAVALARTGQLDEAIARLRQVVEIDPDDADTRFYLGLALTRHGDRKLGGESFREALRLDPAHERAHLFFGSLLASLGDDEQAAAHFEQALAVHPGLTVARIALAKSWQHLGRHPAAAARNAAAWRAEPGHAAARLYRAFALIAAGRYGEAADRLREDLAVQPDQPAFAHALARLLAAAPDDAVRDGARAIELAHELSGTVRSVEIGETIAMALAELGRFEEAVEWQRAARDESLRLGGGERARVLASNLALYEDRRPCRRPWPEDDAVFVPARQAISVQEQLGSTEAVR